MSSGEAPPDPDLVRRDPERLKEVRATHLLDSPAEEVFDRMTRLASRILKVPVSFIAIVDEDRDFYKSSVGFSDALGSERDLRGRTFCHYALLSDGPLVLPDTTARAPFRDVPTVHTLGVRAYLGVPLRTASGHAIGSLCAADARPREWTSDEIEILTELARAAAREIELRRATEALRLIDRRKDIFMATVAHELRQPLAAIVPALAVMRSRVSEPVGVRARELIGRQVQQLERLVADLLDIAGAAEGKMTLVRTELDLRDIIGEVVLRHQQQIAQKTLSLRVSVPSNPIRVSGDHGRLLQVFSNLLGNAVKYTPDGGDICVNLSADAVSARARIKDSGRGISPDALPHVFDIFMQEGDSQADGLGIGLKVVHSVVQLHAGTVTAASEGSGLGSEFVVLLPLSTPAP